MSKRQLHRCTRTRLSVVPKSPGWAIEGAPAGDVQRSYKTQQEAVAAARKLIKPDKGGEVVIHGRDGRIRELDTYVLGGDNFDKISAVEGIFLSREMKRDFDILDRKPLSPQQRRERLTAKYGSQRGDIRRRT